MRNKILAFCLVCILAIINILLIHDTTYAAVPPFNDMGYVGYYNGGTNAYVWANYTVKSADVTTTDTGRIQYLITDVNGTIQANNFMIATNVATNISSTSPYIPAYSTVNLILRVSVTGTTSTTAPAMYISARSPAGTNYNILGTASSFVTLSKSNYTYSPSLVIKYTFTVPADTAMFIVAVGIAPSYVSGVTAIYAQLEYDTSSIAQNQIDSIVTPDASDNDKVNDFVSNAGNQSQDINDNLSQLDDYDKPDPESIVPDIDAYDDDISSYNTVLSIVTNNTLITSLIIIVISFALVHYVLFGKM